MKLLKTKLKKPTEKKTDLLSKKKCKKKKGKVFSASRFKF